MGERTLHGGLVIVPNSDGEFVLAYGIGRKADNDWRWFNFHDVLTVKKLGVASMQGLTEDNELICLVEPLRLMDLTPEQRALFANPEMLNGLSEESNSVILRCRLE